MNNLYTRYNDLEWLYYGQTAKLHLFLKVKSTKISSRKWAWTIKISVKAWCIKIGVLWSIKIVVLWSWEVKRLWSCKLIAVEIVVILIVIVVIGVVIVKRWLGGRVAVRRLSISLMAYTRVSRTVLVSRAMPIGSALSTLIRMANFLLPSTTSTENVSNKTYKIIGHLKNQH